MTIFQPCDEKDISYYYSHKYKPVKNDSAIKKKRVIVISGPTAVGKTSLSLDIASILGGEIISVDSMQVYKGMDIGTAKASKEERGAIPHHMIDICDVKDPYNVVLFYNDAHRALRDILNRQKVPIIVGGAGFYLRTFLYGPPLGPPSNKNIRDSLEKQMEEMGSEVLYERLQMLDPLYADTITEHDKQKIIRALEIISITEKPVSSIPVPKQMSSDLFDFRCWFLYYPKEILYHLVEMRCDEMIEQGFIEEVNRLKEEGLLFNRTASQSIGYKQCLEFLNTDQTQEDRKKFIEEFKKASKKYVKKQFTWFRKEPFFRWVNFDEIDVDRAKEYILQDFEQGY